MDALFLDCYGTLVAEDDVVVSGISDRVAAATDRLVSSREVGRAWEVEFHAGCAAPRFRCQRDVEYDSLSAVLRRYGAPLDAAHLLQPLFAYWQRAPLFPDAAHLLANAQVPICVVSNIDTADLIALLDHHRLSVDHVVTSQQMRSYKPRPECFREALHRLNCAPAQAVHVGDSWTADVHGAHALGIPAVWVNRKGRPRPDDVPARELRNLTGLLRPGDRIDSS
ncbi:HAD family hydrolase [Streptosporangium lutulentum]|uniref:2-haloacid dehalogenase/putative hydrolase of the HAD superfamily n=1 Tax=Streptosporangium lutulentum TaxID=1461250 RepID=A0ABT9QUK8_9ACTN|nr:HAD family hydrolase [Streptosporangium lutulentum]MDP9850440.1 2-haloacid dehalogenase/putative hydrolase of the HAD superfamily [Streptosporangium lutulentum]